MKILWTIFETNQMVKSSKTNHVQFRGSGCNIDIHSNLKRYIRSYVCKSLFLSYLFPEDYPWLSVAFLISNLWLTFCKLQMESWNFEISIFEISIFEIAIFEISIFENLNLLPVGWRLHFHVMHHHCLASMALIRRKVPLPLEDGDVL